MRRTIVGRTGFDEEDEPQSGDIMTMETSEEGEDEEVESLYSGNMDSPIEDVGNTDAENDSDMAVEDSSSVDTIPFVDTVVVGNLPDVVGMHSSSVDLEGEEMVGDEEPVAKKPKKGYSCHKMSNLLRGVLIRAFQASRDVPRQRQV